MRELCKALSVDYHFPARRHFQEIYAAHQRAFSRAAQPYYTEYLTVVYREVYIIESNNIFFRRFVDLAKILISIILHISQIKNGTESSYAFSPVENTFYMTGYEASERFWAHIIMHMLIMRIIPIIMLSKRTLNMCCSLLLSRMA